MTRTHLRMILPCSRWKVQLTLLYIYLHVCLPKGQSIRGKQVTYTRCEWMYIDIFYGLAWVTGWGTTSEGGQQASVLQDLDLSIVDDQTCYDAMTGALGTFWG